MQASNCPRCGKIFTKTNSPVCPACVKQDDEMFEKVRDYVKDNPNHSIAVVSEETEVPVKRIMHYIRDGRLEVSTGMSSDVGCSQCGKPIASGRLCERCAKDIKNNIMAGRPQEVKVTTSGRMRTTESRK